MSRLIEEALNIVRQHVQEMLDKSDPAVDFEVYAVWFSKTLLNWKALVSTTLPDQMYYEVTHNGSSDETYLDCYKKIQNKVVKGPSWTSERT